jgi:hypothetical protein
VGRLSRLVLVWLVVWGGWAWGQPSGVLDSLGCRAVGGRLACGDGGVVGGLGGAVGGLGVGGMVSRDDLGVALARAVVDPSGWFDVGLVEFGLGSFGESAAAFGLVDDSFAARVNAGVALVLAGGSGGREVLEGLLGELRGWVFVGGLYGLGEGVVAERWGEVVGEVVWRFAVAFLQVGDAAFAFELLSSFVPGEGLSVVWRDAWLLAGWLSLGVGDFVGFVRSLGLPVWLEALWLGRGFVRAGNVEYAVSYFGVVESLLVGGSVGLSGGVVGGLLGEVSRFWLVAGDAGRAVDVGLVAVRALGGGVDGLVFGSLGVALHAVGDLGAAVGWYDRALVAGVGGGVGVRLRLLLAFALEGLGDVRARVVAGELLAGGDFVSLAVADQVALRVLRVRHLGLLRLEGGLSRGEELELAQLVSVVGGSVGSLSVEELLVLADVVGESNPRLVLSLLSAASVLDGESERVRGRLLRYWWLVEDWVAVRDALSVWLAGESRGDWLVLLGGALVMLDDFVGAREVWGLALDAGVVGVREWLVLLGGE